MKTTGWIHNTYRDGDILFDDLWLSLNELKEIKKRIGDEFSLSGIEGSEAKELWKDVCFIFDEYGVDKSDKDSAEESESHPMGLRENVEGVIPSNPTSSLYDVCVEANEKNALSQDICMCGCTEDDHNIEWKNHRIHRVMKRCSNCGCLFFKRRYS